MSGARVLGKGDQDENMDDDGRPPGISPAGSLSWAEKVQGCSGGGIPVPERLLEDGFVNERMNLEFPDGAGSVGSNEWALPAMHDCEGVGSAYPNCVDESETQRIVETDRRHRGFGLTAAVFHDSF